MILAFATIIIVFNYQSGLKNSYELSKKIISQTSENIVQQTNIYLNYNNRSLEIITNSNTSDNIYDNEKFIIDSMWHLLNKQNHISSIFLADSNKNFIQVRREPKLALRQIYTKDNKRVDEYIYKDENNKILSNRIKKAQYDPTIRPWYKEAIDKKVHISKPYIFSSTKKKGITISYGKQDSSNKTIVVGAIDISLENLTSFIIEQASNIQGQIYLSDSKNNLITSSNIKLNSSLNNSLEIEKDNFIYYKILNKQSKNDNILKHKDLKYIYQSTSIKINENKEWNLLVAIPENIALGNTKKILTNGVIVSLIFVLIFILIASRFATILSTPITKLSKDIESLKNLNTNIKLEANSKVKEIQNAQNSLIALKSGLESFKKYMPVDLVKQLIDTKKEAKIGGDEEKLAIMFTDIEGFTTISEQLSPQELTNQLSQYFDCIENIITHYEGTIDKYIGDAVMAFWGAPIKIEKPLYKTVKCALQIQEELNILNASWEKEGKARLDTRIGIHYGKTLVGNIGSTNRMNYTIMGDTVNIASRLEGINKNYGTKIMVSEDVYSILIDEFKMDYIDQMKLKGKTKPTKIYTVTSEKN